MGLCFPHLSNRNSSRGAQPSAGAGAVLERRSKCWLSQRQLLHSRGEEVGAVTGGLRGLRRGSLGLLWPQQVGSVSSSSCDPTGRGQEAPLAPACTPDRLQAEGSTWPQTPNNTLSSRHSERAARGMQGNVRAQDTLPGGQELGGALEVGLPSGLGLDRVWQAAGGLSLLRAGEKHQAPGSPL